MRPPPRPQLIGRPVVPGRGAACASIRARLPTMSKRSHPSARDMRPRHGKVLGGWLRRDATGELNEAPWIPGLFTVVVAAVGVILMRIILGPHRVGDYFTETDFYGAYAEGARQLQHGLLDPS